MSLLPDIPIPQLSIQISAEGLDARTLENTITKVVRNQMLQLAHLQDVESRSRSGSATIDITLDHGTDMALSYIEANEKIDQVMSYLPKNIERPKVIPSNVSDIPVLYLNMSARDQSAVSHLELSNLAKRIIKRRLEQLDEIAFVDLHGWGQPEVIITPDRDKLMSLGQTTTIIERAVQGANISLGNVLIKDGHYEYHIRLDNRLGTINNIKSLLIHINGQVYALEELASVQLAEKDRRGAFLLDDRQGISLAVRKKADANNFDLRDRLDELMLSLEADYPLVQFSIANDQSYVLKSSFESLRSSLLYGLGFASLVLFFFFRNWRLPLLIILIIPISLVISLFMFYLIGLSVNIISLTGLILGVGLMIDNSIIIIENIDQHNRSHSLADAAVMGASDVIRPLISSALTTSSVFLPLILLSGMAGALFYDQALSIALSLGVSLVASYFILPVLAYQILSPTDTTSHDSIEHDEDIHGRLIAGVLRYRWFLIVLFLGILGSGYYLFSNVSKSLFPQITRSAYEMKIDWNESVGVDESEQRVKSLINQHNDTSLQHNVYLGEWQYLLFEENQNVNELIWQIYFSSPPSHQEVQAWKDAITQRHPTAEVDLYPVANVFDKIFRQEEVSVFARIQSLTSTSTIAVDEMQDLLQNLREAGVNCDMPPMDEYIDLTVDHRALSLYDINYQALVASLKSAFGANEISMLKGNNEFIPIQVSDGSSLQIDDILSQTKVYGKNGQSYDISSFVTLQPTSYYKTLEAGISGERLTIPLLQDPLKSMDKMKALLAKDARYSVSFDGPYFQTQSTIKELSKIGLLVLALLFLILAAQFESVIQPLIVVLTLPVGSIGALAALYFTGETLNIMSIVGIIILSGIDVNDAILKVDMFNKNRAKGMNLRQSIIKGSETRLRPIVMTTLTTVFAMTPILFSTGLGAELQRPLAIAIIGGLSAGTVASIVLVPVFYSLLSRK